MTAHDDSELPRGSFLAFLRDTDRNLFAWERRTDMTEDIRLAIAYGELIAVHTLLELERDSPGLTLREGFSRWLAGYHALKRRRDSFRFLRALARERATNAETGESDDEETT